jgi:hypothetical protein
MSNDKIKVRYNGKLTNRNVKSDRVVVRTVYGDDIIAYWVFLDGEERIVSRESGHHSPFSVTCDYDLNQPCAFVACS